MPARSIVALVAMLCWYGGTAAAGPIAEEVASAVQRDGVARVLVGLRDPSRPGDSLARRRGRTGAVQERVLNRLTSARFRVAHRFQAVPALAGTVDATGLAALAADPDVERVVLDVGGSGGLVNSVPHIAADVVHSLHGLTGSGVTVAVIDSGVDSGHPDLAGALAGEQCFCSTACCPNGQSTQSGPGAAADDHSHGTHVSGIITSDGAVAGVGTAPDADIVAIKVLDASNSFCCISDVIAAMDWIANHRPDVRAVNMSLGTFATFSGTCDEVSFNPLVAAAVDNLVANGVTVFAASMNGGLTNAMASPACIGNTVAVGATDLSDAVAPFSNSSTALDLLGPGVFIVSSAVGGGALAFSGTSMATPHAVGVAALLLQASPLLTPAEVEAALATGGVPVTDARNGLLRPRVDALGSVLLPLQCGNGTQDPAEECDDGNVDDGDGCDSNCTATGCGNGVVTAGETCDEGVQNGGDCCSVACVLVDEDGDGVCDRNDPCPHISGASATTLAPPKLLLAYKRNGVGGGDDMPKVVNADFVTSEPFDLDTTGTLHLHLRNTRTGGTLYAAHLPAGGLWRRPSPDKRKWVYVDRSVPTSRGVKRALVRQLPQTDTYRLQLVGADVSISSADAPLIPATDHVEVRVEIESAGAGVCAAATLFTCKNRGPVKDRCR